MSFYSTKISTWTPFLTSKFLYTEQFEADVMNRTTQWKTTNELLDANKVTDKFSMYSLRGEDTQQVNSMTIDFFQIDQSVSIVIHSVWFYKSTRCNMSDSFIRKAMLPLEYWTETRYLCFGWIYLFGEDEIQTDDHHVECLVPKDFIIDSNDCICSHRLYKI